MVERYPDAYQRKGSRGIGWGRARYSEGPDGANQRAKEFARKGGERYTIDRDAECEPRDTMGIATDPGTGMGENASLRRRGGGYLNRVTR